MSIPPGLTPTELEERDALAFEAEQSATARRQQATELLLLRRLLQTVRQWRTRPHSVQRALDRIPLRSARAEWDLLAADPETRADLLR